MMGNYELVTLRGGVRSIRSLIHGETMHVGTDPCTEALELHVGQQKIVKRVLEHQVTQPASPFVIWDIGLGPAANAISAMMALRDALQTRRENGDVETSQRVEIHSFEISTEILEFALSHADALGYLSGWESTVLALLSHGSVEVDSSIRWRLHRGDFSRESHGAPSPNAIFHDPYSPARNPEMWSLETFASEWMAVVDREDGKSGPCMLTNYTRSTAVRVTMLLAGWFVGKGVPTGEKSETTIASNRVELLDAPLGREWLSRVRSSTNASPIRGRNYERGPIGPEDYAKLCKLPQFA